MKSDKIQKCDFCGTMTDQVSIARAGESTGVMLAVPSCGKCPDSAHLNIISQEQARILGAFL